MNQREQRIQDALTIHHYAVAEDYDAVMTVLVGSQNYGLDTEKSDFDTFTFVLPSLHDVSTLHEPVSTTKEDELGHINIKDIRLALNLLKKTSPNSVECFASPNRIIEVEYYDLIMQLLSNPYNLRCDTRHMMMAIGGIAHQLSKRNMMPGKRLSHLLRMHCMVHNYFRIDSDILSLFEDERQLALRAKLDPENPKWEKLIAEYAAIVEEEVKSADVHYFDAYAEHANGTICDVQMELLKRKLYFSYDKIHFERLCPNMFVGPDEPDKRIK